MQMHILFKEQRRGVVGSHLFKGLLTAERLAGCGERNGNHREAAPLKRLPGFNIHLGIWGLPLTHPQACLEPYPGLVASVPRPPVSMKATFSRLLSAPRLKVNF